MSVCRLCGGELFEDPLLKLQGMPKAAQFYPTEIERATDKGILLNIFQCSDCELVQLNSDPVDYFREVITAASLSNDNRIARLAQMTEFVRRFQLQGKKALEIGCARGEMLPVIEEAGVKAVGIEFSKESIDYGRSQGRNIIQGYIGDTPKIEGAPYDAFICLNFLEHLPDPGAIIKKIYRNTTAGAAGFVTVPNLDYLLRSRCFYEFVADHLSYFTAKTLTFAFESNGFDVVDCKFINNENDVAVSVRKKKPISLGGQYEEVIELCQELNKIVNNYQARNKRVAVWGAGHRTLALLSLANLKSLAYIVDSAKFKQGKLSPVLHLEIVAPDRLKQAEVDLLIVMVPGLYPNEVLKTVAQMNLEVDVAVLRGNRVEFEVRNSEQRLT